MSATAVEKIAAGAAGATALKIKVGDVLIETAGISITELISALGTLPATAWIGISVITITIVGGYLGGKIIQYYIEKEKNKK